MHSGSLESVASVVREAKEIVVFSGAGLSADSGIPTFRDGATGLWNKVDPILMRSPALRASYAIRNAYGTGCCN